MRSTVQQKTKVVKNMLEVRSNPPYFDIFATSRKTSVASCKAKTTGPTRVNLQEEEVIVKMQKRKQHILDN